MAEPLALAGLAYFAGSIIDISGLSFLGVGVQSPSFDWGTLLTTGVQAIYSTPWAAVAPAAMICITGVAIVYLGEALARALNPRLWFAHSFTSKVIPPPASGRGQHGASPAMPVPEDAVLCAEHLDVVLPTAAGPRRLVRDVSLWLRPGEALGIVGETGSGKTLTALALARLVPASAAVRGAAPGTRRRRCHVAVAPARGRRAGDQAGDDLPGSDVFDEPGGAHRLAARRWRPASPRARAARRMGRGRATARRGPHRRCPARPAALPASVLGRHAAAHHDRHGADGPPRVLIADEPTTALDVTVQAQVLDVLKAIREEEGTSIVLISHNLGVINQLCDRIVVMYAGRIVEEGRRERLLGEPRHPYTRGLLGVDPRAAGRRQPWRGDRDRRRPPAPGDEPPGCAFAPRCPLAFDRCRAEQPELVALGADDRVACFAAVPDPHARQEARS